MEKAVAIIPARFASTRLEGKPILRQTGKYLIEHVVEAVSLACNIEKIVVATDDERIYQAVESFGGSAVMTSPDHPNGTARLAEAAEKLNLSDERIVVNVQGDEPDIPGRCVDMLVKLLADGNCQMATLATPLDMSRVNDPNRVKVVLRADGRAMYFSRAAIPFDRDNCGFDGYLLHLGIYAYRVKFLKKYASLSPTPAEVTEKLEQLRALEHGYDIAVGVTDYDGHGIDTPRDYQEFVARLSR